MTRRELEKVVFGWKRDFGNTFSFVAIIVYTKENVGVPINRYNEARHTVYSSRNHTSRELPLADVSLHRS
jgi:hypothetical protein